MTFNTAAAPPPESVLSGMADAGFVVNHLYGLTETYGPAVVNEWHGEWDSLDRGGRAAKKARQGVRYASLEGLTVMDPETMAETPADGETIGEVMFRGNIVMKGYLKNRKATDEAFAGGWFHSGDLGVHAPGRLHPAQGPLEGHHHLRRREYFLHRGGGARSTSTLPCASCGAAARADDKWGEVPVAYVELKTRQVGDRGRDHRALPKAARTFQGSEERDIRRNPQDFRRGRSRNSGRGRWPKTSDIVTGL